MVKKIYDENNRDRAILARLTDQGNLPDVKNSFDVLGDVIKKIKKNKIDEGDIPDLSMYENVTSYFRLLKELINLKKNKKRNVRTAYLSTFFVGLDYIIQNEVYHPFFTSEIYSIGKLVQAGNTVNFLEKLNFWKIYYPYIGRAIELVDNRFPGFIDSLTNFKHTRDIVQGKVMLNLLNRTNSLTEMIAVCPDHYAKWEECIQTGRLIISPDAKNRIPEGDGNITVYKIAAMIEEIFEQKKTIVRIETSEETEDRIQLQAQSNDYGETDNLDNNDDDAIDLPADTEGGVVLNPISNISDIKKVFISVVEKDTYSSIPNDDFSEMGYDEKIATGIKLLEIALGNNELIEQLKLQYLA